MSISMNLQEVWEQNAAMNRQLQRENNAMYALMEVCDQFSQNQLLVAKSYSSAKEYFRMLYRTSAQGIICANEEMMKQNTQFPDQYISDVAAINLKEDELVNQIKQAQDNLDYIDFVMTEDRNATGDSYNDLGFGMFIGPWEQAKYELQNKLERLRNFNVASAGNYDRALQMYEEVTHLMSQGRSGSWDSFSQTFQTKQINGAAIQKIQEQWNSRIVEENLELKEVTIYQTGETFYQIYRNGKLDQEATDELAVAIAKDDMLTLQAFLTGMGFNVLENNGVKAVLDELFGDSEPKDVLRNHEGYNEGAFVGNLLTLFQSGAEYVGGTLWFIAGSGGSLGLAPVTGGASMSALPAVAGQSVAIWSHATLVGSLSISNIMSGGNYDPKAKAVDNMDEFFESEVGQEFKDNISKNSKKVDGQQVYKVEGKKLKKYGLKDGDQIYLDGQHKDHLEVFDKFGNQKSVLNLDGSFNLDKFKKAIGRKLK